MRASVSNSSCSRATSMRASAAPPSDTDRVALEKLAADLDAVWNTGDAAAVSALYASDGSLRAVITDFGLAGETSDFADGLGTPRYMAPELWRGETATKGSDIYALGVVLYELSTGLGPGTHPAPPTAYVSELDSRWDRAVMPCLNLSPADRPDAAEVLSNLERKPRSKVPLVATGAVLALAAIGAAIPGVRGAVMVRLYPPNVRLAILPLDGTSGADVTGVGALQEASDRIRRLQGAGSTFVVIAPTDVLS